MPRVRNQSKSRQRRPNARSHRLSRRTQTVWLAFVGAMALGIGLLTLGDSGVSSGFLVATNVAALGEAAADDPFAQITAASGPGRWRGIVVHHLGLPAADADRVHRMHLGYGYQGLGYHFLIGNGQGLGDGTIHVGYRWTDQLPGAHVVGPAGERHNRESIGICLIGNGDRRPFSDEQMRSLVMLVRRLQQDLGIPAEAVRLHSDLASVTSPGRFFPAARLQAQLLQ